MIQGVPYDAEIEYLESTGTQWIDTGIVPSSRTRMICHISRVSGTGSLGWGSSGFAESFFLGWNVNYYASVSNNTTQIDVPNVDLDTSEHVFDIKSGDIRFDGVTFGTTTIGDTAIGGQTLYLFARHAEWSVTPVTLMRAKIHKCQIYNGSTIVRDFIPVRVATEGFLYDRVSGKLFGIMGTGSFNLGADTAIPVKSIRKYDNFYTPIPGKIMRGGAMTGIDYVQNGLVSHLFANDAEPYVDKYGNAFTRLNLENAVPLSGLVTVEFCFDTSATADGVYGTDDVYQPSAGIFGMALTWRAYGTGNKPNVVQHYGLIDSTGNYSLSGYTKGLHTHTIIADENRIWSSNASFWVDGRQLTSYSKTWNGTRQKSGDATCINIPGRGIWRLSVYNRALTAAEIAHNHAIDVERFGVPS